MKPAISRKLCCLQFVCALMIITLHTALPGSFDRELPQWALTANLYWRYLADAAISTFFFLSAYLCYRRADERNYWKLLVSKLRTLILPYLLWSALYYAHSLLRDYLVWGTFMQPTDAWTVFRRITYDSALPVLWYIRTLLGLIVLFPVIRWCVQKKWPALLGASICLILVCIPQLAIHYSTMVYWAPVYVLGAYIGYWHRERFERMPDGTKRWKYPLAAAVLIGSCLLRHSGHQLHYLFWIPAPLLLWTLADGFVRIGKLPWWVDTSFYLYCCHLVVEPYAVGLYQKVLGTGTVSFVLSGLLLPLFCAGLCLIGAAIVRKICPWVYAVFTGMRPERR